MAAYIVYAARLSHNGRMQRKISAVKIEVLDSTSRGHLVTSDRVREWVKQSGLKTIGARIDRVDLAGVEQLILRNGFVDRAVVYASYAGTLHIRISQYEPLVRLLSGGLNAYVTDEGYVFGAPRLSSLYVPVISGSYKPPFPSSYVGNVAGYAEEQKRRIDQRITELEKQKYPFYEQEWQNDRKLAALRRKRIKRQWWLLESAQEFERRVDKLRREKVESRRMYRYRARVIQSSIDLLAEQQEAQRREQKKVEKNCEDFTKLLTFVKFVEEDDFWRSEVVQIVAHTTLSGALEVEIVPRSGDHTILFGRLEQIERKFDKLLHFYRNGLPRIGWREYRIIDIRYNDQVVCKK